LEDLFCDTTEGTNTLQLKAEEAFDIIIARKMVNNQVCYFYPFSSHSTSRSQVCYKPAEINSF
jgi:hypothetical protein